MPPDDDDGSYLRWHLLDHMPEQYQLPGIVHGLRWIADGNYTDHRLAADGPLGDIGNAVHYLAKRLRLPLASVITCGDSGNDREMLALGCKAAIVSNHEAELTDLVGQGVYRTRAPYAAGVHEALRHYGVL